MTDIGELVVRIKADSGQMQQELRTATSAAKESAGQMSEAFEAAKKTLETFGVALGAAELVEFAKGALESADNIYIMAERIGFASDTLSALNIPLKQNGSSVDEFASSMKFMSRNIELAAEGNQELIQRFDSLGLSVTKLKSLSPEQQFFEIAKALGQVTDQGELTADAMGLLGRGAAGLLPLIKQTGGELEDFTNKAKELGNALTEEEIKKVHEYEDGWISFIEHLKIKIVEGITALHDFAAAAKAANDADNAGFWGQAKTNPRVSTDRPNSVSEATFLNQNEYGDGMQPLYDAQIAVQKANAKGNNADLLTGGENDAAEQLQPYIDKLGEEAKAAEVSQKALYIKRTEIEATTKAQNDYTNGLRETQELTAAEIAQVDQAAAALYDHKEALAQNKQIADQLTNSLMRIVTNFKDMKSAVTDLLRSVADEILKTNVAKPFANSISGLFSGGNSGGGIGSLFSSLGSSFGGFFADGGSPPVGMPSVVGENGPELFVPNQAGTIVPNGRFGGTTVVVQQTFNMQPGLVETVGEAIRQSAPSIAAMAHASVMGAIQSGGSDSRIVGRRS